MPGIIYKMSDKVKISTKSTEEILSAGKLLREKFKGAIPVLVIPDKKTFVNLNKEVFICKPEHNFIYLTIQIRKQIKLNETEGFYYLTKSNKLFTFADSMASLDKKYCDDGGFLVVILCKENSFGFRLSN
jgi:hypothetical protein